MPFPQGLDSDVLLNAIGDALLGALALGDLASHFPGDDPRWKDTDSRARLRHVLTLVQGRGYAMSNVDATVIARALPMSPFVGRMRQLIAADLGCGVEHVSVKATAYAPVSALTSEARIAAMASVLVAPLVAGQN